MRIRRPMLGPLDPTKTLATEPGGGAARSEREPVTPNLPNLQPDTSANHPSLTALARLLGRQFAGNATRKGGAHE